jgi:hypothetical protein
MTNTRAVPPVSTFVVRFWREWSSAGPRWRGRIDHVQSDQSVMFLELQGMLDFLLSIGIMAEGRCQVREKNA